MSNPEPFTPADFQRQIRNLLKIGLEVPEPLPIMDQNGPINAGNGPVARSDDKTAQRVVPLADAWQTWQAEELPAKICGKCTSTHCRPACPFCGADYNAPRTYGPTQDKLLTARALEIVRARRNRSKEAIEWGGLQ